ncbi:MAG: transposase [Moraxellaceae bacterium]|nr:transposase [Moraxellaceae bacterium]
MDVYALRWQIEHLFQCLKVVVFTLKRCTSRTIFALKK